MFLLVSMDGFALEQANYRVGVGFCEGRLQLVK